jgi:hypothetical protein
MYRHQGDLISHTDTTRTAEKTENEKVIRIQRHMQKNGKVIS